MSNQEMLPDEHGAQESELNKNPEGRQEPEYEYESGYVMMPGSVLGLHTEAAHEKRVQIRRLPQGSWGPGGVTHVAKIGEVEYGIWQEGNGWRLADPDQWYSEGQWHKRGEEQKSER